MLTSIVAPTTSNLMAPATVLSRLKLAATELDELTLQVAEASGLVARYLGYRPEYGTWRETFAGVSGDRLYLGARPAWSIEIVTYRDGAAQTADSYRLERGPHGESAVIRAWGNPWGLGGGFDGWMSGWTESSGLNLTGTPVLPDWTVEYTAGWWLEEMVGNPPAGVDAFPVELQSDFLRVVRWLRSTSGELGALSSLGISKTSNEGAMVEFFSPKDQQVDAQTGIPASLLVSLPLYRRAG